MMVYGCRASTRAVNQRKATPRYLRCRQCSCDYLGVPGARGGGGWNAGEGEGCSEKETRGDDEVAELHVRSLATGQRG